MIAEGPAPRPEGRLRLGTSSWTAAAWDGVFYPKGTPPAGQLPHYAARFDTVEIDATFYSAPEARTVDAWRERTPDGFAFAAKFPRTITHDALLEGCAAETGAFLRVMDRLGERLGPLLLQFRYFRKDELPDPKPFLDRLERFLPALPRDRRFAVEVRNKSLVTPRLLDLLRGSGVALALIDHPWFFGIDALMGRREVMTADFAYVRWLGDRRGIEAKTTRWDKEIVDRTRDMRAWIPHIRTMVASGRTVFGYFNNHYAGYAVGSVDRFRGLWEDAASGSPVRDSS